MSQTMSEQELVGSMKSLIARPKGTATNEELASWKEFYRLHNNIIRARIRRIHKAQADVDDLTQQVWVELLEGLETLDFDPALGSITAWVVKIANDVANDHARRQARQRGVTDD